MHHNNADALIRLPASQDLLFDGGEDECDIGPCALSGPSIHNYNHFKKQIREVINKDPGLSKYTYIQDIEETEVKEIFLIIVHHQRLFCQ